MRGRAAFGLVVIAACARPLVPPPLPPPPPPSPPVQVAAPPVSPWPVPMRVMTWTPDGIVQVGQLPDAPPASPPTVPWFVEPTQPLDAAAFARVVAAVRSEQVPGLSLRGQRVAAWLDQLRALPALTALVLDDTDVDGAALGTLDLALRRIYLARTQVDDAHVVALLAHAPELEVFDGEDCALGDATAAALASIGSLAAVNLSGTRVSDAGGAMLGRLAQLRIVDLGHTRVGAKTVAALRPLALGQLFLDHTAVGPEVGTLAGYAPGMQRFDVSMLERYKPTDADLAWLAHAPQLVEVGLSESRVHDKLALAIVASPKLRELRLANAPITAATVHAIAARRDLEELDLGDTPVDNASAAAILAFPRLRSLRLDHTPIDDTALAATPSAALVELYLSQTFVGDAGLAILDALPALTGLGLGNTRAGDATLVRIAKLAQLRTLVLTHVDASEGALAQVAALPHLERLYLDETHADDATIAALAPVHQLRVLHVQATNVSDLALPELRAQAQLDELAIGDTRVTAQIADLSAWPRLATLSLLGLAIDDPAQIVLAARAPAGLATLDLSNTEIRDPAPIAAVLPALRVLGLVQVKLSAAGQATAKRLAARGVAVVR